MSNYVFTSVSVEDYQSKLEDWLRSHETAQQIQIFAFAFGDIIVCTIIYR